jgi:altronate dehydratase small subunit
MTNIPERTFILLHEKDNTITALADLSKGQEIAIGEGETPVSIIIQQEISYAHKFARSDIAEGAEVIKYGEVIGIATAAIKPGEHVHVHNVVGKRAQGKSS